MCHLDGLTHKTREYFVENKSSGKKSVLYFMLNRSK